MSIAQREESILATIVESYVDTAQPVGSRTVAKRSSLGLSAASVRNVMADLTDEGYLEQPHTSAGRIPTPKGIRLYLDTLLNPLPLTSRQKKTIQHDISGAGIELTDIFRQTSRLLSSLSNQVSMVLSPQQSLVRWHEIDFVLLKPGLVMSVLVLQGGILSNKLIRVEADVSADDLVKYSNLLNDLFAGRTVAEVRQHLVNQMEEARAKFDALYSRAMRLAQDSFANDSSREIFVDGTSNLLGQSESLDLGRMRDIFFAIEERSRLLNILDRTFYQPGVKVTLGAEEAWGELEYCCLVSSPYCLAGESQGVVGIIGPLRMDYSKVVPVVDFTARILTKVLKDRIE